MVTDVFGDIMQTSIKPQTPGTYAIVEKGWSGTLPQGTTRVDVPYRLTFWVLRADKYSGGQDHTADAQAFRTSVSLASLSQYQKDPTSGPTKLLPLIAYMASNKVMADEALELQPTSYLRTLQQAVHAPTTAPMSDSDRKLSSDFDSMFQAAN